MLNTDVSRKILDIQLGWTVNLNVILTRKALTKQIHRWQGAMTVVNVADEC